MARASRTRFAVCIDNSGYPASLELHKIYRVLPDKEAEEDGDIRIVDESGEDYLFEADRFFPVHLSPNTVRIFSSRYCAPCAADGAATAAPVAPRGSRLARG